MRARDIYKYVARTPARVFPSPSLLLLLFWSVNMHMQQTGTRARESANLRPPFNDRARQPFDSLGGT